MATLPAEPLLLGIALELRLTIYEHLLRDLKYTTKTATKLSRFEELKRSDILDDSRGRTRQLRQEILSVIGEQLTIIPSRSIGQFRAVIHICRNATKIIDLGCPLDLATYPLALPYARTVTFLPCANHFAPCNFDVGIEDLARVFTSSLLSDRYRLASHDLQFPSKFFAAQSVNLNLVAFDISSHYTIRIIELICLLCWAFLPRSIS